PLFRSEPLHMAPGGGGGTGIPLVSRTTGPPTEVASFTNVSSCMMLLSLKMLVFPLCSRSGTVASNATKDRADGHAHAGRVTLAENIPRHHFTGHEQVLAGFAAKVNDGVLVHLQTQIGEGDTGAHRVGEERRFVQRKRPVCLVDAQPLGVAVVQLDRKSTRLNSSHVKIS